MASLLRQQDQLTNMLEEARASFKDLVAQSNGRARERLQALHGGWVEQNLEQAVSILSGVDVDKVKALREQRQTTGPVFESQIDAAVGCLRDDYGVMYSINELFNEKASFSADEIRRLGRVMKITQRALRRLSVFRSKPLSFLTSGWLWAGVVTIALLSIPAYRYGIFYFQSSTGVESEAAKNAVVAKVEKDISDLRTRASEPDKSFLSRAAGVTKDIWTLMDTLPKIFTVLSGLWGAALFWIRR